jgi:hypothetical protein
VCLPACLQWPSDEAIEGLWELHRLPQKQVVEWFRAKRQQEDALRKRGGKVRPAVPAASAAEGASSSSSGRSDTDWDAKWDQ